MVDVQRLTAEFWTNGYCMVPDFFDAGTMDHCHELILGHFGDQPEYRHNEEFLERSATEVIPWFPESEDVEMFIQLGRDARLKSLTEAILGEGWASLYCMAMYSRPGSRGQAWHQDCAPEDARKFNLNRLVYTNDIDPHVGGQIVLMPGSHKLGLLPTGQVDEEMAGQVVIAPRKGTLILLHGHTWHKVYPVNRKYRVSTNFRAIPAGTSADVTDVCVYRNMRYRFETSEVIEDRTLT